MHEELSGMKGRSEREIQSLKEHLRLAMAALQEGQKLGNSLDHWESAAGPSALADAVSGVDRCGAGSSAKSHTNAANKTLPLWRFWEADILLKLGFVCFSLFVLNVFMFCRCVYSAPWWLNQWGVQKSRGDDCWICTVLTVWGPCALVFNHSANEQHRVAISWFHYTGPHML